MYRKYQKNKSRIYGKHILDEKLANESEIKKIDDKIKEEINNIVEFAKNSPEPDESELMTEIYK